MHHFNKIVKKSRVKDDVILPAELFNTTTLSQSEIKQILDYRSLKKRNKCFYKQYIFRFPYTALPFPIQVQRKQRSESILREWIHSQDREHWQHDFASESKMFFYWINRNTFYMTHILACFCLLCFKMTLCIKKEKASCLK